jgi:hypothetical protein
LHRVPRKRPRSSRPSSICRKHSAVKFRRSSQVRVWEDFSTKLQESGGEPVDRDGASRRLPSPCVKGWSDDILTVMDVSGAASYRSPRAQGTRRVLRNVCPMIEQSYGRYIRSDFLRPLLEAGELSGPEAKVAVEHRDVRRENRTPHTRPECNASKRLQSGGRGK